MSLHALILFAVCQNFFDVLMSTVGYIFDYIPLENLRPKLYAGIQVGYEMTAQERAETFPSDPSIILPKNPS